MASEQQLRAAVLALVEEFEGKARLCREQAADFLSSGEDDWVMTRVAQGGAWDVAANDLRALVKREEQGDASS